LDVNGSPEYALTWKEWDMPSGPPICALRASARRTSDSGFTGWPTPKAQEDNRTLEQYQKANSKIGKQAVTSLQVAARYLAGWRTPAVQNGTGGPLTTAGTARGLFVTLQSQARLAGWQTPNKADGDGGHLSRGGNRKAELLLPGEAKSASWSKHAGSFGLISTSLGASIRRVALPSDGGYRLVLNPFFVAWLMGYPTEWTLAGLKAASR